MQPSPQKARELTPSLQLTKKNLKKKNLLSLISLKMFTPRSSKPRRTSRNSESSERPLSQESLFGPTPMTTLKSSSRRRKKNVANAKKRHES